MKFDEAKVLAINLNTHFRSWSVAACAVPAKEFGTWALKIGGYSGDDTGVLGPTELFSTRDLRVAQAYRMGMSAKEELSSTFRVCDSSISHMTTAQLGEAWDRVKGLKAEGHE